MKDYTSILFARPSFLEGIARILDIGGTLEEYNDSLNGEDADAAALRADMRAIGQDMWRAIGTVADEYGVDIEEESEG